MTTTRQTYGDLWNRYVSDAFPKLRAGDSRLTYPGEEWGSEKSWERIFAKLFVPAGVTGWQAGIEIGGGGGKYTERVLRASAAVRVWGFDVARNFLDATAERLSDYVKADRLSLHEIEADAADGMFRTIEAAGMVRKVDAMFSIDAMVHVDLQYLFTYWATAALVLKPGGRVLMTLADPTTISGLQKITRDIRKFYKFQGRICPKFEYLSEEIVRHALGELGFEIETLEAWSYGDNAPARDLYLIARLYRTDRAETIREWLRPAPAYDRSAPAKPETYADVWDRQAGWAQTAHRDRTEAEVALRDWLKPAGLDGWTHVIEIGGGEGRHTEALLRAAPGLRINGYEHSAVLRAAAALRLSAEIAADRLSIDPVDPVHPDFMSRAAERGGFARRVDAVFSVDRMRHVDLQYLFAYWLNAALVLKPGGRLLFNVADGRSPEGFARLCSDIRVWFPYQGQACTRFEWQSPSLVRGLLEAIGFTLDRLENRCPDGRPGGFDLWVEATLARPEQADRFRPHLSIGLPMVLPKPGESASRGDYEMPNASDEEKDVARALGQAYWRQLTLQANPDLTREQLREQFQEQWGGARREYTKLGHMVLRQLANMGFTVARSAKGKSDEA